MLENIKIKTLLIAALGLLTVLMVVVGSMGVYNGKHAVKLMQDVSVQDKAADATIARIRHAMETNRTQILLALQHDPGLEAAKLHDHSTDNHFKVIAENTTRINVLWKEYLAGVRSADERKLADEWFASSGNLGAEGIAKAVAAIHGEKWDEGVLALLKVVNPAYNNGQAAAQALSDFLAARSNANSAMVNDNLARTGIIMVVALLAGTLLAIVTGWILLRAITTPLAAAISVANRVAKGDLANEIDVHSTNEIGQLLQALHDMADSLAVIVADVRSGAEIVATASSQILGGNLDLSSRTEHQASALEQTASSMEELTSTVKRNAEHAREGNQLAQSASDVTRKGGEVVAQVVNTMHSINESSRKIVDIIGVIDGIAFQTNILALNAAVEAARAGEQGRGFAVVASEVRTLAQRSASAAKEIKALIGDSVEKVEAGSKLVGQAGATMDEILESIARVTHIMGEITAASGEQTDGIAQINQAISQMDEVTQQNAALVEQSAAAAENMRDKATNLKQRVAVFNVGSRYAAAWAPTPAAVTATVATAAPKPNRAPASRPVVEPRAKRLVRGEPATDGEWEQF